MEGKADYKPYNGEMGERWHVVGAGSAPLAMIKKKDVHKLFNDDFWVMYKIWKAFHAGMGFPDGKPWGEQDPEFVELIIDMETHFDHNFSRGNVMMKYQEAEINCLKLGFRLK